MFKPVKTKKVYEEIVGQIKQLIIDGTLQPGDKLLSERELSEKFNVSRASVREAFSALEIMGIITIRPGEGSFVRQVSYEGMLEPLAFFLQVEIDDIMQLLEVRRILEIEAAGLAAARANEQDIDDIYNALVLMQDEISYNETAEKADAAFHLTIVRAANNPLLTRMMNTLAEMMTGTFRSSRQKMFLVEGMSRMLYESHYAIYAAVADKNQQVARNKMCEHLNLVEEVMLQFRRGGLTSIRNIREIPPEYKLKKDFGFPS